ncbi:phosphopantetheine-binding protein [Flavobacteriales bacterium]|nr:phosphopantetheine-binding protein [Flavobacteriales bacterium]
MAHNQQDIINSVSEYIKKRFLAPNVTLNSADKFADFGIDSMTVVELVMYIEEEFGIVIPADQLTGENLASIDSLTHCAIQNQA